MLAAAVRSRRAIARRALRCRQSAPSIAPIRESRAAALAAGAKLRATAQALVGAFNAASFDRTQTMAIVDTIASEAISPRFTDYTGSAQSVMAVDTLAQRDGRRGSGSGGLCGKAMRGDINRAYAAVRDPNDYRPLEFRRALGSAVRTIRTLR